LYTSPAAPAQDRAAEPLQGRSGGHLEHVVERGGRAHAGLAKAGAGAPVVVVEQSGGPGRGSEWSANGRAAGAKAMCEAMYAISGERRSYEEDVEERTLRIRFA
jgi:hypothetical protein